ncbi:MAG: DUF1501 domain-containing protein [Planctomycetales bacterium]
MARHDDEHSSGWTRRDFLRTGGLAPFGLSAGIPQPGAMQHPPPSPVARHCVFINLVGGASHLETWDPKPDAPEEIRGPFGAISTATAGVFVSELLPKLASQTNQFALVRSVYHDAAPIHETGQQLLQTGALSRGSVKRPHFGAVLDWAAGTAQGRSTSVILPQELGDTGVPIGHGQGSGFLGPLWEPAVDYQAADPLVGQATRLERKRFGHSPFACCCLRARQWLEQGARAVTINMFDTVSHKVTWDAHANGQELPASLADYQQTLCPLLDEGLSALLDDLSERGLLSETLVVVAGEFGRTPKLNRNGGRDHWTDCWSILIAGAGVQGGQTLGASDRFGIEPVEKPIHAARVAATIYYALGIDPNAQVSGPGDLSFRLIEAEPMYDLWS